MGIALLEFSTILSEITKSHYENLTDVILMRLVHTALLLSFAFLLSKLIQINGKTELNYISIASLGIISTTFEILFHDILARYFHIEVFSLIRQSLSGLIQALFWFPAFILIGSRRTDIFNHFKDYEQRLIVKTRAESRNSHEFKGIQEKIQEDIQKELFEKCNHLKKSIEKIDFSAEKLSENNQEIQALLLGEELRRLSMDLETFGSEQSQSTIFGQNLNSVRLLANQFKILYAATAKIAPLKAKTYALVLILLITPAFINYYTFNQVEIYYPLIALTIFFSSLFITRSLAKGGPKAIRNSSIWILITGLIPWIFNEIGQYLKEDPNAKFSIFINMIALPAVYYIIMKIVQVLQSNAIDLLKSDSIVASKELKTAVTKIVSDEFSHTLSHRWAIYIHGKILTRLAATALKLETAKNSGDLTTYNSTIQSLLLLLNNPSAEFEKSEIELYLEIASRLDPWLGLVDVSLHIDDELKKICNSRVREVGEVIEEILSNSMRHGKAHELKLQVLQIDDKDIEIRAIDNATVAPPLNQTRFGLGTRIFNLASDGRWKIDRLDSSTVFVLTMAIE